jgi:hypothetical protein
MVGDFAFLARPRVSYAGFEVAIVLNWGWNRLRWHRSVPAAISNAVFDAIGVRLRSVPFVPEKVLAAMKTA